MGLVQMYSQTRYERVVKVTESALRENGVYFHTKPTEVCKTTEWLFTKRPCVSKAEPEYKVCTTTTTTATPSEYMCANV